MSALRFHSKSKKVQQLNIGDAILARLLPIGREEDPEDNDEDSPSRLAFRVLDVLSQTLPPTQIFPSLHRHIQTDMASADPAARKAALVALGVTVEGCSEFIRPHVAQLWPIIEAGLADASPIVKKAACIALGCLCEWLPEECAERHESIVPVSFDVRYFILELGLQLTQAPAFLSGPLQPHLGPRHPEVGLRRP